MKNCPNYGIYGCGAKTVWCEGTVNVFSIIQIQ